MPRGVMNRSLTSTTRHEACYSPRRKDCTGKVIDFEERTLFGVFREDKSEDRWKKEKIAGTVDPFDEFVHPRTMFCFDVMLCQTFGWRSAVTSSARDRIVDCHVHFRGVEGDVDKQFR